MGVSPTKFERVYTGKETIQDSFVVDPVEEKNIRIYSYGALSEYIEFEEGKKGLELHMTERTTISYSLSLPDNMKPGEYKSIISINQFLTPEERVRYGGAAAGFAGVGYVIKVRVPNEGKFLEAEMKTEPSKINLGDTVYFNIDMLNFGTEELNDISTMITVKDPKGEEVLKKDADFISSLKPAQKVRLISFWETESQSPGIYSAQADIDYGGNYPAIPKTNIKLGDIYIEIVNVTTQLNDSIAKIFIDIQSNWNDNIENVYAEIAISNNGNEIDRIKTSSVDLEPWGAERLLAFWERNNLDTGDYTLDIYVYYYDKEAKKQVKVELKDIDTPAPQGETPLIVIVIVILVIIMLINLAWFIINIKKKKK
jgi:hypothetical protein